MPEPSAEAKAIDTAFKQIFAAVPKGKLAPLFNDMSLIEISAKKWIYAAPLLNAIRGYFIETSGEESPFVKKIDQLLPRS